MACSCDAFFWAGATFGALTTLGFLGLVASLAFWLVTDAVKRALGGRA